MQKPQLPIRDPSSAWHRHSPFIEFVALVLLITTTNNLSAFVKPHPHDAPLPTLDKRNTTPAGPLPAIRQSALAHLHDCVAEVTVRFDGVTATPSHISSPSSFLCGPNGSGGGISPETATNHPRHDPHRAVKGFIDEHHALFGYKSDILQQTKIIRHVATPHNNLTTVVWQQQVHGIDVFEGILSAHTTGNNELVNLSSRLVPAILQSAKKPTPSLPVITAIKTAALSLGIEADQILPLDPHPNGKDQSQRFRGTGLTGPIQTRLVWLPLSEESIRLCHEIILTSPQRAETFRVLLDAATGELLLRRCLTVYLSNATFRIFTSDSPSPFSPGHPSPVGTQPPLVDRTLVTLDALNTNASPLGWIPDGTSETLGNNVDAHADRDADDLPDLPRPQGTAFRVFDYPIDLNQDPAASRDAAVVQLFYWCNWVHDRFYELGFTEAAGNFQSDNFGRGGLDGDPILADAQDGAGFNNANYTPAPDGLSPRIQMFLFNGPDPDRDGDFDAEIIIHEYTHGLSDRLVGGGIGISAIQSAGMGEGWSDFYALALLSEPGDDVDGNYAAGGFVTHQFFGLTENYYFGIRRYPYSTDMSKNPLTFKDIDPTQASEHFGVPLSPLNSPFTASDAAEVHNQGEVWCATLWDARANLIRKHGFSIGNTLSLQLVTDGMKLSPPNPNFLQARDAIIQADQVNSGGANFRELWSAFAKRGMGANATSPSSSTTSGVTESYELPDDLLITSSTELQSDGPVGGPFTPSNFTLVLTNIGSNALSWTLTHTSSWLQASVRNGSLDPSTTPEIINLQLNAIAETLPMGIFTDLLVLSNVTSGIHQSRPVSLHISQPDHLSEQFNNTPNDLARQHFTFTPDGTPSFYSVCREPAVSLPSSPDDGTPVFLGDDDSIAITLAQNHTVSLFGTRYSTLFIGSNGYITFNEGDLSYNESLLDHFRLPRISALFDDLNPAAAGTVSWRQLSDRIAITFEDVPEFGTINSNSFQIELFFNDVIRLTCLAISAQDGLAGLSRGTGIPVNFRNQNFSDSPVCGTELQLQIPPHANEGDGTLANQGVITLPSTTPTNLTATLASSNTDEITVPPTVLILAGQSAATFDLTIIDDALIDGSQRSLISVSAPGYTTARRRVEVHDNESAALSLSAPPTVTEGQEDILIDLDINPPPERDLLVRLATSDSTQVSLPQVVLIPRGQSSLAFHAAVPENFRFDEPTLIDLSAFVTNWPTASTTVIVTDNETTLLTLTLTQETLEGVGTLLNAGMVSIPGTLPTNLVVQLSSSDESELTVPGMVTILAGNLSVPFDLTIIDDTNADGPQSSIVTAHADGWTAWTRTLTVFDDETPPLPNHPSPPHLSFNIPANTGLSWSSTETDPVVNGDFETGNLSGWELQTTGAGTYVINNGNFDPLSPDGPLPPFAGRFSALSEQSGPGTRTLIQQISLPGRASSATLRWAHRIRNHATAFDEDQFVRIEVRSTDGTVLATPFTTSPGDPLLNDWTEHAFDLSPFIGQSLRLAFVQKDSFYFLNLHVDSVTVDIETGPTDSYDIYFGTTPNPGPAERLGNTTDTSWTLPNLQPLTTYYWQVVARQSLAQSPGPIWQFETRGVDVFHWRVIDSPQLWNQPFTTTLTARDELGSTVSNFTGIVHLSTIHPDPDASPGTTPPASVTPTNTANFTNGVWTGLVTVLAPSSNIRLLARDDDENSGLSNPFSVIATNDLSIHIQNIPSPIAARELLAYTVVITNTGPASATGILFTNILPTHVQSINAISTQGSCDLLGNRIVCDIGTLPGTNGVLVSISMSPLHAGSILTNHLQVSRAEPDSFPGNNSQTLLTPVQPPVISVSDTPTNEGDSGTNNATFNLLLSAPSSRPVHLDYSTADNTARAPRDYTVTSGNLTFTPGTTNLTITVPIHGDLLVEPDETFTLNLSHPLNGLLATNRAIATILNDDLQLFATPPFLEDWETGGIRPFWITSGNGPHRTTVTSDNPPAGNYHLTLDSTGGAARNELTLGVNLQDYSNVQLQFRARSYDDEPHGPPSTPFTAGADFDGVAVSVDGISWHEVQSLRGIVNSYAQVTVDLDAAVATHGLAYSSTFLIRFNQFDDFGIPFDGIGLDDISITGSAPGINPLVSAILNEDCLPANGGPDPGETLTVLFALHNTGTNTITNVTATLLPDANILSPSAPQSYGTITAGGGPVSRTFTFTAAGVCGETFEARLQLNDGSNTLPTAVYQFRLGGVATAYSEDFDSVTPPQLPAGWSVNTTGGALPWRTVGTSSDTSPNALFADDPPFPADNRLTSPSIPISTDTAELSFRHRYNTELGFDGGVLAIAIDDQAFTDIIDAGGVFLENGYVGFGWEGNSGGFITTRIRLPAAAAGHSIRLRWQFLSDVSVGAEGWFVDSISVTDGFGCCVINDLAISADALPQQPIANQPLQYTLTIANSGPASATGVIVTNTLPPTVRLVSITPSQGNCTINGSILTCGLGTIGPASSASVTIHAIPMFAGTLLTNVATIHRDGTDSVPDNNNISHIIRVALPLVSATDVTVQEGDAGSTNAAFQISLSAPSSQSVNVDYTTADNTATAPGDYSNTSGQITFTPGLTSLTVNVPVNSDSIVEENETFFLQLLAADNGTLDNDSAQSTGTILDDDRIDILSITRAGTGVSLTWSSAPGRVYLIQYKDDLNDIDWIDLPTATTATGPTSTRSDLTAPSPQRFYRVILQQSAVPSSGSLGSAEADPATAGAPPLWLHR